MYTSLIRLRGFYATQSNVSTNIDELIEDYLHIADSSTSIASILTMLLKSPSPSSSSSSISNNSGTKPQSDHLQLQSQSRNLQPQSCVLALTTLSHLIKSAKSTALEGFWAKLGTVAVRSMDDKDPEVRKSCVGMCVEMRGRLGDDDRLFGSYLSGLGEGHRNLLTYYFAR